MTRLDPETMESSDLFYTRYYFDRGDMESSARHGAKLSMEERIQFKEEKGIPLSKAEEEYL